MGNSPDQEIGPVEGGWKEEDRHSSKTHEHRKKLGFSSVLDKI